MSKRVFIPWILVESLSQIISITYSRGEFPNYAIFPYIDCFSIDMDSSHIGLNQWFHHFDKFTDMRFFLSL